MYFHHSPFASEGTPRFEGFETETYTATLLVFPVSEGTPRFEGFETFPVLGDLVSRNSLKERPDLRGLRLYLLWPPLDVQID